MKLAGTVILYHPDKDLPGRIKTYIDVIEMLYVVDNSENTDSLLRNAFVGNEKIIYLHDGENKGIAARLNEVSGIAIKDGYSALLTMDQDSFFDHLIAKKYAECILNFNSYKNTAMFGVEFLQRSEFSQCNSEKVSELITSGSILNLNLFETIGGFDEKLFIDYVDHEYCYRAIIKGYSIIKFNNIFLEHKIGEVVQKRSPGSLKYTERSFHSVTRIYYMVRNYFYINKIYKNSFPQELKNSRKSILTRIKNKLLYSNERSKLIAMVFRAFKDYKREKMGKLDL